MNSLFGDATTAAPTPATLAEAESLFSGNRSPVPSFRLNDEGDGQVPDMDLEPPKIDIQNGKPMISKDQDRSEGVGGWISNLVKKGKGDDAGGAGGSGRYKRLDDDEQ